MLPVITRHQDGNFGHGSIVQENVQAWGWLGMQMTGSVILDGYLS